jgi:F-type H+-transporting ATPase subunit b
MARTRTLLLALAASLALLLIASPAHATEAGEGGEGEEAPLGDEGAEELTHEAEECIHLLEAGGTPEECHEAPNPILPETNEIIWGGLAFLILFGLLAWKGVPAIRSAMDARTERIRQSLDDAERAKTEAEQVKADYERQVAEARGEAARIIEEARQAADAVRRDLVARAEQEAADLRTRNTEQIEAERTRVLGEVQGQVATLALDLAERVVQANLDREANMRLIDNYINDVARNGART